MNELILSIFNSLSQGDLNKRSENKNTILKLIGQSDFADENVNFYPGNPSSKCCMQAYFVSLSRQPKNIVLNNDQLIPLSKILRLIFEKVLIDCLNKNLEIFLLTDSIEMNEFDKYKEHFRLLKRLNIKIEIFYIGGDTPKNITDLVTN